MESGKQSKQRTPTAASPTATSVPSRSVASQFSATPAGNRSLARLFRSARSAAPPPAGLAISSPNDPAELEADRIAAEVMLMPEDAAPLSIGPSSSTFHRKCAACEEEEQKKIHRSATAESPGTAPPIVNQVLSQPGQPLPDSTRTFFEPRLGADLFAVRIHTDTQAARSADAVQAKAYTVGNSIAFASGQYSPQSSLGNAVIAHELVHVMQSNPSLARLHRTPESGVDAASMSITPEFARGLDGRSLDQQVAALRQMLSAAETENLEALQANLIVLETELHERSLRSLEEQPDGFDPASHPFFQFVSTTVSLQGLGQNPIDPEGILFPGDQLVVADETGQIQLLGSGDIVGIGEDLIPVLDSMADASLGNLLPPGIGEEQQLLLWEDGRAVLAPPVTADLATLLVQGQPTEVGPATVVNSLDAPWRRVRDASFQGLFSTGLYQLGSHPISRFNGVTLPPGSRIRFADVGRALTGQMDSRLITVFERGTKRYFAWDAHLPVPGAKVSHPYYHINQNGMYPLFGESNHAAIPAAQLPQARGLKYLRIGGRVFFVVGVVVDGVFLLNAGGESFSQGSGSPLAAQAVRTIGGWGGGWIGAKAGCAVGGLAGIETGPGLVLTCIAGGLVGGFGGYYGADWVADMISED